jgi:hypothetical protein
MDVVTGLVSFLFTVFVLSYLVGDSVIFRAAIHIFIGVTAGYVFAVVLRNVLMDKLFLPMLVGDTAQRLYLAVPLILSILLLMKSFPATEWMGRPVVAFLVGVGAAAAITGAVSGTIFPQVNASINMFDMVNQDALGLVGGVFVLLGTVFSLLYFQFTTGKQKNRVFTFLGSIGQIFISITLGVIFAGVLAASLTAFVDRVQSLILFLDQLLF